MPSLVSVFQNENTCVLEGQCDLSAAGAVGATRGTSLVVAKTGAGTYTFTFKGTSALKVYEILHAGAQLMGAAPATAFSARVTGVTQTAATDDIVVAVTTLTNAATPAAADTTATVTLDVDVSFRTARMGNPL